LATLLEVSSDIHFFRVICIYPSSADKAAPLRFHLTLVFEENSTHYYAVKMKRGIETFETQGSVVYSTVGLGMGLCFTVTEPPHPLLLEAWRSGLIGDKQPVLDSFVAAAPVSSSDFVDVQSRNVLKELIRLLRRNGALSESDSSALIEKLRK
jgi:hypothetical protein